MVFPEVRAQTFFPESSLESPQVQPTSSTPTSLDSKIKGLKYILDTFKSNSDELSLNILRWGNDAIRDIDSPEKMHEEYQYLRRILVHPQDHVFLRFPVICLDLVCDLEDLTKVNIHTGFKVHHLAIRLQKWITVHFAHSDEDDLQQINEQARNLQANFIKINLRTSFILKNSVTLQSNLRDDIAHNHAEIMQIFAKILKDEKKPYTFDKIKIFVEAGLTLTPKILRDVKLFKTKQKISQPFHSTDIEPFQFDVSTEIKEYLNEAMHKQLCLRAQEIFKASKSHPLCYSYLSLYTQLSHLTKITLHPTFYPQRVTAPVLSFLKMETISNGWDFYEQYQW